MSLLFGKILVSVCVVLGLSWTAENVSTRVAGMISGMPLGAVLVLFFVGRELGPEFAADTAVGAVPSIAATVAFALGYFLGSRSGGRMAPAVSTTSGLAAYLAVAAVLDRLDLQLAAGVFLSLVVLVAVAAALHSFEPNPIANKVRMTWSRMAARAGTAAAFVVAITSVAHLVGPQWSGLLIGFPMTFLPFLLIIHVAYSGDHARTIIRSFPLGLTSLLVFLVVASRAIPIVGVNVAILGSLGIALAYLALLGSALNRLRPANVVPLAAKGE